MAYQPVLLANIDKEASHTLRAYEAAGGYAAMKKMLAEKTPAEVIELVKASGLRGRGGAGFPCGLKWTFLPKPGPDGDGGVRYLAINADESEPGTFKDRLLMDFDPHLVLEGIAIACYACRMQKAYFYIRGEYHHQARVMENAIKEAYEHGVFGGAGLLNGAATKNTFGDGRWKVECYMHRS